MAAYPTNPVMPANINSTTQQSVTQQPTAIGFGGMPTPVMGGEPPNPPYTIENNYPHQPYPNNYSQQQPLQNYYPPQQPMANNYAQQQQPMMGGGQGFVQNMTGSLLNQMNPNPFAQSGAPVLAMSGAPQRPPIMPLPPMAGIPLGLELLVDLDHIIVKQKVELFELVTAIETANRYDVLNGNSEKIYFAGETSEAVAICCGGVDRPFKMTIVDFGGRTVLTFERPCDPMLYLSNCWPCCCCWLGTIGGKLSITLADGTLLGEMTHVYGCYKPQYEITDADGQTVMNVTGRQCDDCCCCKGCSDSWAGYCCCKTTDFQVTLTDGTSLGKIQKKWAGIRELVTDADTFEVEFPKDLNINWKALLFGAVFLIDFMYYEHPVPARNS